MINVLFVCWGNICRSPMCEFIFKDMVEKEGLADAFHIESRATHTDEIWNGHGSPVYPPAREILAKHGISCEGKTAQLLEKSDYEKYDYIIGMDDLNLKWMPRRLGRPECPEDPKERKGEKISLLMDYTSRPRGVADPWYTRDFRTTYEDALEGCRGFLDYIIGSGKL